MLQVPQRLWNLESCIAVLPLSTFDLVSGSFFFCTTLTDCRLLAAGGGSDDVRPHTAPWKSRRQANGSGQQGGRARGLVNRESPTQLERGGGQKGGRSRAAKSVCVCRTETLNVTEIELRHANLAALSPIYNEKLKKKKPSKNNRALTMRLKVHTQLHSHTQNSTNN